MRLQQLDKCGMTASPTAQSNWLYRHMTKLPRPFRFLAVGACGLLIDLSVFTAFPFHLNNPLGARALSLAVATFVTWRLNRAVTFNASGQRQHEEALRYAIVTAAAQGTSFAIFSALALTFFARLPQAALLVGAAVGAVISYIGHKFFSFRVTTARHRAGGAP